MSSGSIPSTLEFHSNGGTYPPHGLITPDDHGPFVVVTAWVMTCLMTLTLAARLGTRRNMSLENTIITVAAAITVVHSVVIHLAVNYGLGRHRAAIGDGHFYMYSKARYTSQVLEIIVLCLSKSSLLVVFLRLTPSRPAITGLRLLTVAILLWGFVASFALLFQCDRPQTWDLTPGRCHNQDIIYYSNGVVNILTDVLILALPPVILFKVQISRVRKLAVFIIFAVRGLVCIATVGQLVALKDYLHSSDRTWFDVNLSIWTQVMVSLSIMTACIPLLKPFLENLQFSLVDSSISFNPRSQWLRLQSRGEDPRSGA